MNSLSNQIKLKPIKAEVKHKTEEDIGEIEILII